MNLAALVQTGLRTVPAGVRGFVTLSRVVPGVLGTDDVRTGDTTQTMQNIPCVVTTPKEDAILPTGIDRTRVRDVTIAGADCTTFQPDVNSTAILNGKAFTLIGVTPIVPDGVTVVAYTLRGTV